MRKEQLQNIISYVESIKDKDGDYNKYLESIDLLANRLLDYFTPNYQGKYMDITQEEYDELDNLFKDSIQKSQFYSQAEFADEENKEAKELKKDVNDKLYKELLTDFYTDFKKIDIKSGKSFYEEMQKPKDVAVEENVVNDNIEPKKEDEEVLKENEPQSGDITASEIYKEGFYQKDKMTVTYKDGKISGTFIYQTNYDPDKEIASLIKEYSQKYPDYKNYFQALNDIEKLNELGAIPNSEIVDKNGNVLNFLSGKDLKLSEINKFDEYKNELSFMNANADFILKLRPVLKEINEFSVGLKASYNVNLDRRNYAMTGIAKMLDSPEVVTNARSVSIEKDFNGQKIYTEGTFIDDPKGKTIDEFEINDPVHTLTLESYNTAEAKKAIANLQVIDYICGRKRELNNIKFEFDPKTNKLIGVQGINNEKSFFTPNPKPLIIGEEDYSDVENLKVIDSEMAAKILAFDEKEFKAMMVQYGLDKDEVFNAWRRVEDLQDVIKNPNVLERNKDFKLIKDEKFKIIDGKEAWEKLNILELKTKNNLFSKVVEAQQKLVSEAKVDKNLDDTYKILRFTYNNKVLEGDKFLEEARTNAPLFGTSRRYNNILKGLNDYFNEVTSEAKAQRLDDLQGLVNTYFLEKIKKGDIDSYGNVLKNLSGKDLARVNLVKNLNKFIKSAKALGKETSEALTKKEENEKKVDEFNSTYRLGKYQHYAKLYKDDDGKIMINANILEREKRINFILSETVKKMDKASEGVDLSKSPAQKEKYDVYKNYIETTIENSKEQILIDYHHGLIPKEYLDYKMDKYDKQLFDFNDEENKFAYTDPNSEIFKNNFQEALGKHIEKDLGDGEKMVELDDLSNKQELEIEEEKLEN